MKRYVNVDFGFELLYPAEYGSTYLPYNVAVMCANDGLESLLYVSAGTSQEAGSSGFAAISTLRTEDTSSPWQPRPHPGLWHQRTRLPSGQRRSSHGESHRRGRNNREFHPVQNASKALSSDVCMS